ncbi:Outer envelope pore protein 21B [Nymphaea thermarum]|nr:Outer envelope pore protein 21B [Nymphaea thermarum]
METSLRCRSDAKALCIHAKEKFPFQKNFLFQVHGELNTYAGTPSYFAMLTRYFNPEFASSLGIGVRHDRKEKLMYDIQGKKAFPISPSASLTLDTKGKWTFDKDFIEKRRKGKFELTWRIFNFREDQDIRLRVGYEMFEKVPYLQIRENNWTLNADAKGRWNLRYDL